MSKIEKGTEDGGGTTLVDPAEGSDEAYGFSGASFATHVLSAAKKLGTSAKSMVVLAVFSLLFAASCFLDNYASGQQSAFDFLLLSALGGMGTAVVCFVLMVLIESLRIRLMRRDGVCRAAGKGRTRYFACALVAILLCWLFWWLLYYPGCTSVDSQDIMKMVLGLPYESDWFRYDAINSHHPLLYTAIVGAFVNAGSALGDVTWGVAALSFAQMCFLAFACAYCSNWLLKSTGSRAVFALTVAFFALNPLIARYAVTLWKDVLFAGTFLLFSLVFIEVVQTRGRILCRRSQTIQILILGACVMLLRSNGALVVVVALLIAALWCTRFRWRIIGGGLCSVFLVFALQGTVSASIGISPGHFAESVGVPLQQIARTVVDEGALTDEQEELIGNVLPLDRMRTLYTPYSANALKFSPEFNDEYLESHKVEFLLTWAALFPDNMGSYVRAWCDETMGYWHIGVDDWLVADVGYTLDASEETHAYSAFPGLLYDEDGWFAGENPTEMARSILNPLFNIACMVWLLLFAVAFHACFGRTAQIISCAPYAVYWATFLVAAPTFCEFRYLFALHLALPVLFVILLFPMREAPPDARLECDRCR